MKDSFQARFRARREIGFTGVFLGALGLLGGGGIAFAPGCSSSVQPPDPVPSPAQSTAAKPPTPPPPAPVPPPPPATAQTPPAPVTPVQTQPPPTPPPPVQPPPAPTPPAPTAQTKPPAPPPPLPPPPPIQSIGVTPPTCVLKGTSPIAKGTLLFDMPTGGRAIASFTGTNVPMALSEIPADPVNNRAKLVTSTGTAAVRLEGYVQASAVPVFTVRDVPIMAGNVWIASAQKARLFGATASSVIIEMTVAGSRSQSVRATTTCDALALQKGTPVPVAVPENGRGYLTKEPTVDIYSQPNGDVVFSLQMIEGSSQFFWSTESRAGFVHVKSRADLAIDGWTRLKDLDPLKKGEMMDQVTPPQTQVGGAQLAFEKPPRIATATKDIVIRARRDERERPIGVVEAGAEIYILETVAGWTNVLPKSIHLLPPDDGGFWIPSSETPK